MKISLILTVFCLCGFLSITEEFVSIYWGLPDTACVIGKLFLYKVPPDAFKGEISHFDVSEATTGSAELPDWLFWNEEERKFFGVPALEDLGPHYLSMQAVGLLNSTHVSVAKDVFTIYVREETPVSGRKLEALEDKKQLRTRRGEIVCSEEESVISLAILMDLDLHKTCSEERKNILESAAKDLNIPIERLRLYSWDYAASLKPDLLMAGPGEGQGYQQSSTGTFLTWKVGCGLEVSGLETSVGNLEHRVIKGELSAVLGYRIISWQVMSIKMGPRKRRRIDKRSATETPVAAAAPRTRTPEIVQRSALKSVTRTHNPEVTPEPNRVAEKTATCRKSHKLGGGSVSDRIGDHS